MKLFHHPGYLALNIRVSYSFYRQGFSDATEEKARKEVPLRRSLLSQFDTVLDSDLPVERYLEL